MGCLGRAAGVVQVGILNAISTASCDGVFFPAIQLIFQL